MNTNTPETCPCACCAEGGCHCKDYHETERCGCVLCSEAMGLGQPEANPPTQPATKEDLRTLRIDYIKRIESAEARCNSLAAKAKKLTDQMKVLEDADVSRYEFYEDQVERIDALTESVSDLHDTAKETSDRITAAHILHLSLERDVLDQGEKITTLDAVLPTIANHQRRLVELEDRMKDLATRLEFQIVNYVTDEESLIALRRQVADLMIHKDLMEGALENGDRIRQVLKNLADSVADFKDEPNQELTGRVAKLELEAIENTNAHNNIAVQRLRDRKPDELRLEDLHKRLKALEHQIARAVLPTPESMDTAQMRLFDTLEDRDESIKKRLDTLETWKEGMLEADGTEPSPYQMGIEKRLTALERWREDDVDDAINDSTIDMQEGEDRLRRLEMWRYEHIQNNDKLYERLDTVEAKQERTITRVSTLETDLTTVDDNDTDGHLEVERLAERLDALEKDPAAEFVQSGIIEDIEDIRKQLLGLEAKRDEPKPYYWKRTGNQWNLLHRVPDVLLGARFIGYILKEGPSTYYTHFKEVIPVLEETRGTLKKAKRFMIRKHKRYLATLVQAAEGEVVQ